MIGRLTGRVVSDEVDTIVLDVRGVGYELTIPLGTVGRAPKSAEGESTLFVHTHAREDALLLYGFASEADRRTFRTLIGVSNVGPKTALALLSALPAEELARAIQAKDVAGLTRIPGVGKKTAERLVLELKDKLLPSVGTAAQTPAAANAPVLGGAEVLIGALVRMGFKPAEVERAVASMGDGATKAPLADAVREALKLLAK
jgi:Holliday junction DNA helicase RuvA